MDTVILAIYPELQRALTGGDATRKLVVEHELAGYLEKFIERNAVEIETILAMARP